jgi:hypothetical protein
MVNKMLNKLNKSFAKTFGRNFLKNFLIYLAYFVIVILLFKLVGKFFKKSREYFTNGSVSPIKGYYKWTWDNNPLLDGTWDIAILFGGEVPKDAIDININKVGSIKGNKKYLNLGGGMESGKWSITDFDYINQKLPDIKKAGWDGLCFDIEVCTPNVSFVDAFKNCFQNCKKNGLDVFVTMSHINPYQCQTGAGQGTDLVNEWIKDPNVDYISPQLYSYGDKLEEQDLSMFKTIEQKILPSIPYAEDWEGLNDAVKINCGGYIVWNQTPKPAPGPSGPTGNTNFCGSSWEDASAKCGTPCPGGQDSECSNGDRCYANTSCPTPVPSGPTTNTNFCGKDWNEAMTKCSKPCPGGQDSECSNGDRCYANTGCK